MSCDRRCEDPSSPQFNLDDCEQCPGADRHPSLAKEHIMPVKSQKLICDWSMWKVVNDHTLALYVAELQRPVMDGLIQTGTVLMPEVREIYVLDGTVRATLYKMDGGGVWTGTSVRISPEAGIISERPETETPCVPDSANPLDAQGVPVEGAVLRREFVRMRTQIEDMDRRAEIAGAEYLNLNAKCLRLKTALEFYADPKHYDVYGIVHNDADGCSCRMKHHHPDLGLIARTALFMEFGLSRGVKAELVWIPEAPEYPGLYAYAGAGGYTLDPVRARIFRSKEACQTWCDANPRLRFVPKEHGFAPAPPAEG